jgi:hypothetical protein
VVLDEIGGLSQAGQVALLRLLESREVLPLGATRPVPIDVRLIATSSRDPAAEVEAGGCAGTSSSASTSPRSPFRRCGCAGRRCPSSSTPSCAATTPRPPGR